MSSRKKTRSRRKSGKPDERRRLKLLLASLFLLGFLLVCLVTLSLLRQSLRPAPPPPPLPPSHVVQPEDVRVELESALLRSGVSLDQVKTGREGNVFRYEVQAKTPPASILDDLSLRLLRISPDLRIETLRDAGEMSILCGGVELFHLRFRQPVPLVPVKPGPRLAIIMDDLGGHVETARSLLAIDLPVTFAILPGESQAARVAELAYRGGREIMIHIPMEPQSYPATNPGGDALLTGQPPEEIRRRFRGFLQRVPHAVGGNNHMGSRFTEYREGMDVVLEEMKEAGLFFVDSRTTGGSVAFAEARRLGIPAAARDLFLDNVQDVDRIALEIRKLASLAARRGQAVGICHPYAQTLEALRREAPFLREQQIELVPVSQLLVR